MPAISLVQREQIRLSILRYALRPVSAGVIKSNLVSEGNRIESPELVDELVYLRDKGLLTTVEKTVSPENLLYRTTANGRDCLALQGQE
jgi:hypothetical protein